MARSAIPPGEHLAEELTALHMSAAELARQLNVPTNRVTGILNGQRTITGDTALRLGHFFLERALDPRSNLQTLDLRPPGRGRGSPCGCVQSKIEGSRRCVPFKCEG